MATCYNCGCTLPPGTAVRTRVLKGHAGRRKSGYVVMCAACSKATEGNNKAVAITGIVVIVVLGLVFYVIRGY